MPSGSVRQQQVGQHALTEDDRALVRELVRLLYGGGQYTSERLVKHTLMHYKSFERLMIARVGYSISHAKQLKALLAKDGGALSQALYEQARRELYDV